MSEHKADAGGKKVKNIAAVLYLLVLIFLVGGSYINQQHTVTASQTPAETAKP